MTLQPLHLVVLGLSLSSSWGNGHATTYRALLKAFAARGNRVTFLERDVAWYAGANRDLASPDYCELILYPDLKTLRRFEPLLQRADAVMVGSYVPDGVEVGAWVQAVASGPVVFYDIDTPVTLAKLDAGDPSYITPAQIAGYDVYFSFTGGPTLKRLEQSYGAQAARALYCSVDAEAYRPRPSPIRWDLSYLGTYSEDRQPALERLLLESARRAPERRFIVAGPQYPKAIAWPANVERIDHVPPADHPAFYAGSRYTLNLTRADMARAGWSPSVRLFEAAACAVPIISDAWDGIGDLFTPGNDIVLADDAETVLTTLARPDRERRRMGEQGRARILSAHTSAHRAADLEAGLRQALERRAGRAEHSASPDACGARSAARV